LDSDELQILGETTYIGTGIRGRRSNDTVVMGAVQRRLETMYCYMKGHWQRVSFEAGAVGEDLDLGQEALDQLRVSAYLMDIGMIDETIHALVNDNTDTGVDYMQSADVRRAVERHPVLGARKLEELGFPRPIVQAVRHHHEWYNGWGYPDGLSGVSIPMLARVLMVADAYVSLMSDRPFRAACNQEEALEEIVSYTGIQFDPYVVPVLERIVTHKSRETESLIDKTMDLTAEEFEA
jgi:HD-GYP domain-containing protein (c-di-GMP phosphodiesterase class II)